MALALGIIDIIWKGVPIPISPESGKVVLGGIISDSVECGQDVHETRKFQKSEIEAKTVLKEGDSIKTMYGIGKGELIVLCDTGQTYTFRNAILVDRREFSGQKGGEMPLKWHGPAAEETL